MIYIYKFSFSFSLSKIMSALYTIYICFLFLYQNQGVHCTRVKYCFSFSSTKNNLRSIHEMKYFVVFLLSKTRCIFYKRELGIYISVYTVLLKYFNNGSILYLQVIYSERNFVYKINKNYKILVILY